MNIYSRLSKFNSHEQAVIKWQYNLNGSFYTALWKAISMADDKNLDKLSAGFPIEVEGYRLYTRQHGWWESVQDRLFPERP